MFESWYSFLMFFVLNAVFLVGYIGNSNAFPTPLSAEEECKYIKLLETGDDEAKNILIERNLRLVAHIAKKYSPLYNKDSEDLISIGTIGLIKAVKNFNNCKGRLSTFAAKCIENEILMFLRSQKKTQNEVSLNDCIGCDKEGNDITLFDIVSDEGEWIFEEIALKMQIKKLYEKMKEVLKQREQLILSWRYGLNNCQERTQNEIASSLKISRSYVSRIEKKALEKLHKSLEPYSDNT